MMPNFDAGHYFLTVLAPIRLDSVLIDGQSHSRRHLIREVLTAMPSGERTVASQGTGAGSPFARTCRTHFTRFVVLDDVVFNGRVAGDTLLSRVLRVNPLAAQPVDRLSSPFLIWVADFDASGDSDDELKAYLAGLWSNMAAELGSILEHCVGFGPVKTADDFFNYIKKCQVETTMPFNDYWSVTPALTDLDLTPYAIGAAGAAVLAVGGPLFGPGWLCIAGLLALAVVAFLAYRKVMDTAQVPFPVSPPPAPGSDLPTVLKALYLQRAFTDFAIRTQGLSDQAVRDAFAGFLAEYKPNDTGTATQPPGIIGV